MINRLFEKVYLVINKKQKLTVFLIAIVLLLSIFRLFLVPFNNNVEIMLPSDAEFSRSLKFLRESNLSDKIVLSLSLEEENRSLGDLVAAADRLKSNLKPPFVQEIESGVIGKEVLDGIEDFLRYVPQIVTEKDLISLKKDITPENVNFKLKQGYKNMLSMNSMFFNKFFQNDPLSVKTKYLKEMKDLAGSIGYRVKFKNGHFISMDERHVMLILKTPVLMTDSAGSRELVDYISKQIKLLPDYVSVDIIGGHLHTLSNERILKNDIAKTVFAISFILLALLILVFKSIRALLVFIVPVIAIVISMGITSLIFGELSAFVVGLSAVIAGIAVDYGIHIYLAMQSGGVSKLNKIAMPILVGAFTTMGVFVSFFFSNTQGYHQFASLTNLSIVISILLYLFVLPRLLYSETGKARFGRIGFNSKQSFLNDKAIVLIWVILLSVFVFLSRDPVFSNDMKSYDGSSDDIFYAEEQFHKTWGSEDTFSMLVAEADGLEEVLKINEELNVRLAKSFEGNEFSNIARIYPSMATRRENLLMWNLFWKNGYEKKLKALIKEYGVNYGYSDNAFNSFFDDLYTSRVEFNASNDIKILDKVKQRFLQKTKNGYYAISYFLDKSYLVERAQKISNAMPDTFLISRTNMAKSISESVYKDVKKLAWVAGLLIVSLTILLLRNIRLTLLALLPVVTSIFAIIGSFSLLGYSLNAPAMIAVLVVVGLCIDYGVFMVYDCQHDLDAGTVLAVTLSAATTVAGGGVLLLATHPVLFYVGVTMAIGIFFGYCSAVIVIPACFRLGIVPKGNQ